MKESGLTTQFGNDLEEYRRQHGQAGSFWYKIGDVPRNSWRAALQKVLCPRCLAVAKKTVGLFHYDSRPSPFDVMAVLDGAPIAMEFKCHADHTAFPIKKVQPHQVDNLTAFDRALGLALVMIFVEHDPDKVGFPVPEYWHNSAGRAQYLLAIPIRHWHKLTAFAKQQKRASLRLGDFWSRECGVIGRETVTGGRRRWDIEAFQRVIDEYLNTPEQTGSACDE